LEVVQLCYLLYVVVYLGQHVAGFFIITFSLSIIMKLMEMEAYGELIGLVALLS
jgi:hypothetical protein